MNKRNIGMMIGGVIVTVTLWLGVGGEPQTMEVAEVHQAVPHRETDEIYIYESAMETVTTGTMVVNRPAIAGDLNPGVCGGCIWKMNEGGLVEVIAPAGIHVSLAARYTRVDP